jgi:hypothetical protein
MNSLLLALLVTIAPSLASAAPAEVFEAVLTSEALKRQASDGRLDITNIKETAVYRCPGCFTIEVTLGRNEAARQESFNTRMSFGNGERKYEVTHNGNSAPASAGRCIALGRVGGEDIACGKHSSQVACESKDKWERCAWRAN